MISMNLDASVVGACLQAIVLSHGGAHRIACKQAPTLLSSIKINFESELELVDFVGSRGCGESLV